MSCDDAPHSRWISGHAAAGTEWVIWRQEYARKIGEPSSSHQKIDAIQRRKHVVLSRNLRIAEYGDAHREQSTQSSSSSCIKKRKIMLEKDISEASEIPTG